MLAKSGTSRFVRGVQVSSIICYLDILLDHDDSLIASGYHIPHRLSSDLAVEQPLDACTGFPHWNTSIVEN